MQQKQKVKKLAISKSICLKKNCSGAHLQSQSQTIKKIVEAVLLIWALSTWHGTVWVPKSVTHKATGVVKIHCNTVAVRPSAKAMGTWTIRYSQRGTIQTAEIRIEVQLMKKARIALGKMRILRSVPNRTPMPLKPTRCVALASQSTPVMLISLHLQPKFNPG